MRTFLFTILLALAYHFSFGQSKEIKTLKHELAIVRQDTSRSNILREISSGYWGINSDSSLKYGKQALALAQRISYYEGEANALHVLGVLYRNLGDYPKSLEVLFKGLQIAEDKNILKPSIRCLNALGLDYIALKDYKKSIDYFKQAVKINNKLQDGYWQAQLDVNLSTSYNGNNQKDSAWFYIQKGYKKNNEINDTDLNKIIPFAMGSIQFELGDYQAAFQNAHKSIYHTNSELICRILVL